MILKRKKGIHSFSRLLRSTVSLGERKRGEHQHFSPPLNPRQRGTSSDLASNCTIDLNQTSKFSICLDQKK